MVNGVNAKKYNKYVSKPTTYQHSVKSSSENKKRPPVEDENLQDAEALRDGFKQHMMRVYREKTNSSISLEALDWYAERVANACAEHRIAASWGTRFITIAVENQAEGGINLEQWCKNNSDKADIFEARLVANITGADPYLAFNSDSPRFGKSSQSTLVQNTGASRGGRGRGTGRSGMGGSE